MKEILTEISLLSEKDCLNIVERQKSEFTYPLHKHREYELNFVMNAAGVKRVVGDSVETIGDLDLVLIANENLEHVWEQGTCTSSQIREITIQFSPELFSDYIRNKNQFISIKKMMEAAKHGISFPFEAIMKVYNMLDTIAEEKEGFLQLTNFLVMFYYLSKYNYKVLSSSTFAKAQETQESRRILKVKEYVNQHFAENISLENLAALCDMSPSSFSRFFKIRTHKTVTDYITDIRLGHAARELIDSSKNISEICYASGFNNLSNFNRYFKAKKGMTPKDFRALYKKNKVIV